MTNQQKQNSFLETKSSEKGVWGMYLFSLVLIATGFGIFGIGTLNSSFSSQMTSVGGVLVAVLGVLLLAPSSIIGSFLFTGFKKVLAVATAVALLVLLFVWALSQ